MNVLIVEDSKISVLGIKKILNKQSYGLNILEAENGELALNLLYSIKKDSDLPDFILLDLNMPVMNGKEFLAIIRKDKRLCHIPVTIHTTSTNAVDYFECKALAISGYYIKHIDYKVYKENIMCISNYWFNSYRNNL